MIAESRSPTGDATMGEPVQRLTRQQYLLIAFCTLVSLIDGFDAQSIAFAGPSLLRELGLSPGALGSVFSAGLLGGICGALPVGHVERRIGRRALLLICALWFSAGAFATALATSGAALVVIRFLSGIGLGMALPVILGTMTDSIPHRVRARALSLVMCALPGGGMVAGVVAAGVIPRFGWEALFYIGGVLPVAMVALLYGAVPAGRTMIAGDGQPAAGIDDRGLFRTLFAQGGPGLLILLPVNFLGSALAYVLMTWTPTLLIAMGVSQSSASIAGGVLNGGAMTALLVLGYLLDRRGVVGIAVTCYALTAAFLVALALTTDGGAWVMTFAFLSGFVGIGVQIAVTYMFASTVGAELRVAVLSVAMVFSRSGGAAGPLAIGMLAQAGHTPATLLLCVAAIPALTAAGTLAFGAVQQRRRR